MHSSPRTALALVTAATFVAPAVWGITGAGRHEPTLLLERAAIVEPADPAPVTESALVAGTGSTEALALITTTTTTSAPVTTTTTVPVAATTAPPAPAPAPATTAPPPTTTTTAAPPTASAVASNRDLECESAMLSWTNETRNEADLPPVLDDPAIKHVPVDWSQTMADRADLAHNPHYGDQIFAARAEAHTAAENVGRSAVSARAIYDEFLRSDTHRAQILGDFSHAAVGCVRDAGDQLWVTVDFWG